MRKEHTNIPQPTLLGTNEYEGDFLVPFTPEKGINTTLADIVSKALFDCPSSFQSLYRSINSVPVYRYRYQGNLPSVTPYPWIRGAYHSAELPLLFGMLDLGIAEPEKWELKAARYMQDTWMAFVKDPVKGLQKRGWPLYDPAGEYENLQESIARAKGYLGGPDPIEYDLTLAGNRPNAGTAAIRK